MGQARRVDDAERMAIAIGLRSSDLEILSRVRSVCGPNSVAGRRSDLNCGLAAVDCSDISASMRDVVASEWRNVYTTA